MRAIDRDHRRGFAGDVCAEFLDGEIKVRAGEDRRLAGKRTLRRERGGGAREMARQGCDNARRRNSPQEAAASALVCGPQGVKYKTTLNKLAPYDGPEG